MHATNSAGTENCVHPRHIIMHTTAEKSLLGRGFLFRTPSKFGRSYFVLNGRRHFVFAPIGAEAN